MKNIKTSWDLDALLNKDGEMQKHTQEWRAITYEFINKWKDRTDYLENPLVLLESLEEYDKWVTNYSLEPNEFYYVVLQQYLDSSDSKIKAHYNKSMDIFTAVSNDIQFYTHKISKIPVVKQEEFLQHDSLKKYRHMLQKMFDQAHYLLSEDAEKILTLKAGTSCENWIQMTHEFLTRETANVLDKDENEVTLPFGALGSLLTSKSKKVRDIAHDEINRIRYKHIDTATYEINSILQDKKTDDTLRGTERPDQLRLVGDDISPEILDTLLDAVRSTYDISHEFYKLKANLMGVTKLAFHDRSVPYGDVQLEFTFEESVNLVYKVLKNLDLEFGLIFKRFLEEGHVDVYPKKDKTTGGFCISTIKAQPVFILLNHTNKLSDVLALAHEFGHAINAELMKQTEPGVYFGNSIALGEVASTFMEDYVLQEILATADDDTRLTILIEKLSEDIASIQGQVALYRFEQELHMQFRKEGYLPKEIIGELFLKHIREYLGESIEYTKDSGTGWISLPHLRMFFYVYSYASGMLISKSLQGSVKEDPSFIQKVKVFLSTGESKSPSVIFSELGIDIKDASFWNKGLNEVRESLEEAKALAKKLGKIQ